MNISKDEKRKLLRMAYSNGYQYFKHSVIELEDMEHLSVLCSDTHGNNSLRRLTGKLKIISVLKEVNTIGITSEFMELLKIVPYVMKPEQKTL